MSTTIPTPERFSVPSNKPYARNEWQRGYESQRREEAYWIEDVEGEIPAGLQGTLYRNGPGLLDIGGYPIHHPFDGDGMICQFTFVDGRAHFQNRFVRTQPFCEEREAGKPLYRGVFGTQKPGGWLANAFDFRLKNIANTNVIYWGGKLLALWEAALPHRLDPQTLATHGTDDLDGLLADTEAFAAHPRVTADGQTLINFCIKPGLSTAIWIYELDPAGNLLRQQARDVPGFAFIHDFAISDRYCLFFQNPVNFNPIPFALGMRGPGECISFQPDQETKILVIPRDPKEEIRVLSVDAGFVFHHANAFERDGTLYIDSICYAGFPEVDPNSDFRDVDFDALEPGLLWRFALDLEDGTVSKERIISRCCEFPTAHPSRSGQDYRYLWTAIADQPEGNAPLQGLMKYDWHTGETTLWSNAPHGYAGEPVFVPSPEADAAEDEGWLLTLCYDAAAHRSDLVIHDARDLTVLATLHLKYHIPYGLHGSWTDDCFLPDTKSA